MENTNTVLQSQFHDLKTDVHIIPIEWHAKLHSMVDPRMSLASLRTVPKGINDDIFATNVCKCKKDAHISLTHRVNDSFFLDSL